MLSELVHSPIHDKALPPAPQDWSYDPAFGVVHLSGCLTCLIFRRHLAAAAASSADDADSSFAMALKERDYRLNAQYLRGIDDGIQLCQHGDQGHDMEDFVARSDYAELLESYNEKNEIAKRQAEELAETQEELKLARAQFETLKGIFDEMADVSTSIVVNSGWDWNGGDGEGRAELQESQDSVRDEAETLNSRDVFLDIDLTPPDHLPSPPRTPDKPASSLPRRDPTEPVTPSKTTGEHKFKIIHPTTPSYSGSRVDQYVPGNLGHPDLVSMGIPAIVKLMNDACKNGNAGNSDALNRVKLLMTLAQRTPRETRTKAQEFALRSWRGPTRHYSFPDTTDPELHASLCSPSLLEPSPLPYVCASRSGKRAEVFVDAAFWGIGFEINSRWLAWRLKAGWNNSGRDNNWTEMVAVEIGLRTLITSGFRKSTLTLRSDNTGVVRALKMGRSKHAQQAEILRNVLHLANEHEIELLPVWVSTTDNLADKYSRGQPGPNALVFPIVPVVPRHLENLIELAVTPDRPRGCLVME